MSCARLRIHGLAGWVIKTCKEKTAFEAVTRLSSLRIGCATVRGFKEGLPATESGMCSGAAADNGNVSRSLSVHESA